MEMTHKDRMGEVLMKKIRVLERPKAVSVAKDDKKPEMQETSTQKTL